MDATYEGHAHVAKALLDAGADPNHLSPSGYTCLSLASTRGHVSLVGLLLSHGAQVTLGKSPLQAAAGSGHADVVQALLAHLPDTPEGRAELGRALLEACSCGWTDVATVLLRHGADWGVHDTQGHTPIVHARARNHAGCTRLLEVSHYFISQGPSPLPLSWSRVSIHLLPSLDKNDISSPACHRFHLVPKLRLSTSLSRPESSLCPPCLCHCVGGGACLRAGQGAGTA